jgi:hypothetical protein
MPVRVLPVLSKGFLDSLLFQSSMCSLNQKEWLTEKFLLYTEHHAKKTLGQLFPPLYEEYFTK